MSEVAQASLPPGPGGWDRPGHDRADPDNLMEPQIALHRLSCTRLLHASGVLGTLHSLSGLSAVQLLCLSAPTYFELIS